MIFYFSPCIRTPCVSITCTLTILFVKKFAQQLDFPTVRIISFSAPIIVMLVMNINKIAWQFPDDAFSSTLDKNRYSLF